MTSKYSGSITNAEISLHGAHPEDFNLIEAGHLIDRDRVDLPDIQVPNTLYLVEEVKALLYLGTSGNLVNLVKVYSNSSNFEGLVMSFIMIR